VQAPVKPADGATPEPVTAPVVTSRRAPRGRAANARPVGRSRSVTPVLVRQLRNGIEESVHRGDIVEVDIDGRIVRVVGDPERVVTLRSAVKPFGAVALLDAGGLEAFDLSPAELAIMAGSHSGEDVHVRTLQAVFRRAGVRQSYLATGTVDMPLDKLTAARLARDGEAPGEIRHMCSGQHAVFILLSRLRGWDPGDYWRPEHPSQVAYRSAVARAFGTEPRRLRTATDNCGIETFAFPLREVARAYAMLADPAAIAGNDSRSALALQLTVVRDAMAANPEMVGGTHDRVDTSLMKTLPGRVISKAGAEGLRAVAILPAARSGASRSAATGLALTIEDGDGFGRASGSASIEALHQAGIVDDRALRELARYHRPPATDPRGHVIGEAVPDFDLAPVGELIS
jgi:L-asparaginase II